MSYYYFLQILKPNVQNTTLKLKIFLSKYVFLKSILLQVQAWVVHFLKKILKSLFPNTLCICKYGEEMAVGHGYYKGGVSSMHILQKMPQQPGGGGNKSHM
jgi:hypothetical protein